MRGPEQEGRGIGLANKIRAYALQDQGMDTLQANLALGLPADARRYDEGIAILRHFGLRQVRLMSNNPLKIEALEKAGIAVEREELWLPETPENAFYLQTKIDKMGHIHEATI